MTSDELNDQISMPELIGRLEQMELEATDCIPDVTVYVKLLAAYLCENDLCGAKFLWKRIPQTVKDSFPDLENIWKIGRALWERNFAAAIEAIQSQTFPDEVGKIIQVLKGRIRDRYRLLVGLAYTSISIDEFAANMAFEKQEAIEYATQQHGWAVDEASGMLTPCSKFVDDEEAVSSDQQLKALTDFVSFFDK